MNTHPAIRIPLYDWRGVLTGFANAIARSPLTGNWPPRTHAVLLDNGRKLIGDEPYLHGRVPGWRGLPVNA